MEVSYKKLCTIFMLIWAVMFEKISCEKISVKDTKEALRGVLENCEPQPTDEALEHVIRNTKDAPESTKCLRHCIMEIFSVYAENGKELNEEIMLGIISMSNVDEEKLKAMIKKCNADINAMGPQTNDHSAKCEIAHKHFMCYTKEFEVIGYEFPEYVE